MIWIAPSEKDAASDALEKRLWAAANQLWAGAGLKQSEYSERVLGLIFLRFAEDRFATHRAELEKTAGSSRLDDPAAYHAETILYLPATTRYAHLLNLPEGTDIGLAVNDAMRAIERDNPHMAGVLPKSYQIFDSRLLAELLKTLSSIPSGLSGDAFGKIYEYFLGTFAMSEGQKGGEPSGARSTALAARRVSAEALINSTRPPASSACSSKSSLRFTGASSTSRAVPAACLPFRLRGVRFAAG